MRSNQPSKEIIDDRERAIKDEGNLAVRAGAGSGKTTVLIRRIVHLLVRSWDEGKALSITNITAMTFTRKAAAEMQERLQIAFRKLAEQATDARTQAYWRKQIEDLPRAMIGTIDSFCGRVLREFGFRTESGEKIEPDFDVLDGYESLRFQQEATDHVINRLSALSEEEAQANPLAEACHWWAVHEGYHALARHLKTLLSHSVDPAIIVEAHGNAAPPAQRVEAAWASLPAVRRWKRDRANLIADLQQMVSIVEALPKPNKTLCDLREDLIELLGLCDEEGWVQEQEFLRLLGVVLLTQKGEPISTRHLTAVASVFEPLQETWQPLLKSFRGFDFEAEVRAQEAADRLARLLEPVHAEYLALCREANRYDFTALARRTRDLLRQSPEVCQLLKNRFRYVLVDEFQDTNPLQWEIISRLVGDGPDRPLDPDRLFIVGDPQQSIYRFRHADVGVFRRVTERQRLDEAFLKDNFRSLTPMPLDLMDRVFRHVFDPEAHDIDLTHPFEVEYQELRSGYPSTLPGEVRYVIPLEAAEEDEDEDEETSEDEFPTAEGLGHLQVRAVVDQLVELHGRPKRTEKEQKTDREDFKLSWGDMAVLLPSRTVVLTALEKELRKRHIPFVVSGGIGFWQRQEVGDVINLASFLADNGDELALFGVLRSPLGQLTDTEILFLSQFGRGSLWRGLRRLSRTGSTLAEAREADDRESVRGHWERLPSAVQTALSAFWAAYPEDDKRRLRRALSQLENWRLRVDRMAHADLLQRALEESGAYAIYASDPDEADAMLANLDRLFDVIRAEEARSAPDLNRLVRRLRELREDFDKEQQANLALSDASEKPDAVQVMTVHAAKGLEFPVVAVMKMERKAVRGSHSQLMVKSPWDELLPEDSTTWPEPEPGTFAVSVRHPRNPRGRSYRPMLLQALHRLDKKQELAESRRLFYVAATRAQQCLILAGKQPGRKKNGDFVSLPESWQKWFEDALALTEEHKEQGVWEDADRQIHMRIETATRGAQPPRAEPIRGPSPAVDLDFIHETPAHPSIAATELERMLELWRADPHQWRLRYGLHLKPGLVKPGKIFLGDAEDNAGRGALIGTLAHRILEMSPLALELPPPKQRELLEAMAADLLAAQEMRENGEEEGPIGDFAQVRQIVQGVENILDRLRRDHPDAQAVRRLIEAQGETETPFGLRLGRWHVWGRYDKLLSRDPGFEIVDWKTDQDEDFPKIVERHRVQMKLYALALHRAGLAALSEGKVRVHLAMLHHPRVEVLDFAPEDLETFAQTWEKELEAMDAFGNNGEPGA